MTPPPTREPIDTAMRQLHRSLLDCWNRRDAGGFAALFAPEGNVVGFDGSTVDGVSAIRAHLEQIFADHQPAAYVAIVREVRPLGPGTALLRAVVGMVPPGQMRVNPAVNAVQSLVARQDGARWRIELFQNTPAAWHGRPDAVAALTKELQALGTSSLRLEEEMAMGKMVECAKVDPSSGCTHVIRGKTDEEVMRNAMEHAKQHGIREATPELMAKVKAAIREER